jgi:hypothetical protein
LLSKKNGNTNTAIYMLTNNILKAFKEYSQIVGIFCDIAKAFVSVNHYILLDNLCHYGIHGTSLLWFRSYLEKTKNSDIA